MRALLLTIFALIALSGCGDGMTIVTIDPELETLYEAFTAEAEARGIGVGSIQVEFTEDASRPSGQCFWGIAKTPTVVINRVKWESVGSTCQRMIMFHELGHCALGREHTEEPSLMRSNACELNHEFDENPESFMDELFGVE